MCDVPLPRTAVPWTPSKVRRLERFANSETVALRAVAASHPRISHDTLSKLLVDEDATVRRAAIKNPVVSDRQLRIALADNDMGIAAYARLLMEENING